MPSPEVRSFASFRIEVANHLAYPRSLHILSALIDCPLLCNYSLKDIGASGTNTASAALDATLVTSVLKHGYDAGSGAVEGYQSGAKGA